MDIPRDVAGGMANSPTAERDEQNIARHRYRDADPRVDQLPTARRI